MSEHLYAVIMAGGVGSRLWPRSRRAMPKQFLDLLTDETMLQQTVTRLAPLVPLSRILVVTSEKYTDTVLAQIPDLPPENVIIEPGPRGTAPCIGLAAISLQVRDAEAIMAVCSADHRMADEAGFRRALTVAAQFAQQDQLVTLGITPDQPHTGYGYIQRGAPLGEAEDLNVYQVQRFTEKPDLDTAQQFVTSGEYYWNAGIFIWRVSAILQEMASLLPALHTELQKVARAWDQPQQQETLAGAWERVPRTTIDYGIMEKSNRVAVLPVDIGWDDVGNWATLSTLVDADAENNVVRGQGQPLLLDTTDSYVYASAGRLVAAVGLEDFVVVDTPDALLICPKEQAQAVRDVVQRLKSDGLDEYL
ncbi:MAG: mannose-1-phosphate guanylyltransferase [Anaerolineae bacterium]